MRILVYGAGGIGALLAHNLCKGKNEVTILAREGWKEVIDKKGLIIKHVGFLGKTVDKIRTIDKLEIDDKYDMIFVALPYNQVINVFKKLGQNISSNIVLVGNNIDPLQSEEEIQRWSHHKKNIAFAFQYTMGYRKDNMVVCLHGLGIKIIVGGSRFKLSDDFEGLIKLAFKKTRYKINFEKHMEAWFLTHFAHILPEFYVCFIHNYNIQKTNERDAAMSVVATSEAHKLLKSLGYPICPEEEEENFGENIANHTKKLHFFNRTRLGRNVMSNRCKHAFDEIAYIDKIFNQLRKNSSIKMIVWEELRENAAEKIEMRKGWQLALQLKI